MTQTTIAGAEPDLPPELLELLLTLPVRVDRKTGAALVTQHIHPVSNRTLERWPLVWQRVNGRAITRTLSLFQVAYAQLAAAPEVMGGQRQRKAPVAARPAAEQTAA